LPQEKPTEAYWPGVPDLAVEVVSPGDRKSEVAEKVAAWLDAGCRAVWVIDPKTEAITVHPAGANPRVISSGQVLEGDPVVPGFLCAVKEVFRSLQFSVAGSPRLPPAATIISA
jgi:Uma2 family endonuclease